MELTSLTAISPIDGRYRQHVHFLDEYFSEYALMKYRVYVEVQYLIFLADKKFFILSAAVKKELLQMAIAFNINDAEAIKKIESTTQHDVKAVEYFLKNELEERNLTAIKEWVHFGLTSQDVNNTAIPLSWKTYVEANYLPAVDKLTTYLHTLAKHWKHIPMLARTHGQPASPTILGKEMMVFVERLQNQLQLFNTIPYAAKFGGATGNFNAHNVAFSKKKWIQIGNEFVQKKLGLQRMQFTTQIEHYDSLATHFDTMKRINTILIDLCRDMWMYISMEYFKQKTKAGEVGSSAMPHKVNPIDFENAEGNLGIANALFAHLSEKLPISRLQRDLTDSTVLRNIGTPVAHTMIALHALEAGFNKLILNADILQRDLDNNWAVITEAIQTILRRENYPNPYEALKELTRGKKNIDKQCLHSFIDTLNVTEKIKQELKQITPLNYVGVCAKI